MRKSLRKYFLLKPNRILNRNKGKIKQNQNQEETKLRMQVSPKFLEKEAKQNELQQLKIILKQHSNEFINDDFIEQPNIIPEQNPTPTSDKHVHFSEQNEEFVFSKESIINANQLNSDIFMESSFETDKNINLTLSENEYFTKNL